MKDKPILHHGERKPSLDCAHAVAILLIARKAREFRRRYLRYRKKSILVFKKCSFLCFSFNLFTYFNFCFDFDMQEKVSHTDAWWR